MKVVIEKEAHIPALASWTRKRLAEHALSLDEVGFLIAHLLCVESTALSEMYGTLNGGIHARVRLSAHWGLDSKVPTLC